MRIWSLHPKYLDSKGIVALWRETLLAKNVLEGNTKGYKNHPQLNRFKNADRPTDYINQYLIHVYNESVIRGFKFDRNKIDWNSTKSTLKLNKGQLDFEWKHLLHKLKTRDPLKYNDLLKLTTIEPHPIFTMIEGGIEDWEKI